ncbi:carbamoyltransferase [Desulfococcaceae bacterium HSG7]|nr:carbamoyltransferase [Desulfococcaceae bacterium HSG7]
MYILGISAYHGDCSACLIKNGQIVAAVEEERFTRIKHWAGFPSQSIAFCLKQGGLSLDRVDKIAVARDPKANLAPKLKCLLRHGYGVNKLVDRFRNYRSIRSIPRILSDTFKTDADRIKAKIVNVEHHKAHSASAFFVSPFEEAAILTIDGFGDFVSSMQGRGRGNTMTVLKRVYYPHSIGVFYTLVTQFLGFHKFGDEYKVMGLASYGKPTESKKVKLEDVIRYTENGQFRLNLKYFRHHKEDVDMTWDGGEPTMAPVYSEQFVEAFGNPRKEHEELTDFHRDLAASAQALTEEIIFSMLRNLHKRTKLSKICLAGGVAMNSVANGKILDNTPFDDIYIQSAAGDAGTSLGAAYYAWNMKMNQPRMFVMQNSYWGPEYSQTELGKELQSRDKELKACHCVIKKIENEQALCRHTAELIAQGNVVGWFQGRMEWGPRALGNRSILADPRKKKMVAILNSKIKKRESFRPFAPSVLLEKTDQYFEKDYPDPFMLKVYPVRSDKRSVIPAVTHVDGSGRLQTVKEEDNPLYYRLISEFDKLTGVPIVLNTSFNENEPIINTPKQAIDCFLRTEMDVLVLGPYLIERKL